MDIEFRIPYFKEKVMKKMTWADLYRLLHDKANKLENIGKFDWQARIGDMDEETDILYFDGRGNLKNKEPA